MSGVSPLLHVSATGIYLHAFFVSLTLGLPLAILVLLYLYQRTGDVFYMRTVRRLTAVLAVNFALGAVTGTLVEFGLVQVWPGTILAIASFVFTPLALELIAFINEIAFLILFIALLGRVRTYLSMAIISLYWFFALLSGALITSVNTWLVAPWGTGSLARSLYPFLPDYGPMAADPQKLVGLKIVSLASGEPIQALLQAPGVSDYIGVVLRDPMIVFSSPYTWVSVTHNLFAAVIVGGSLALAAYSYRYWRTRDERYLAIVRTLALPITVLLVLQPTVVGHEMGLQVVYYNPTKFAAMEGAYETLYNPVLGLIVYGDPTHPIPGLDSLYRECVKAGNTTIGDLARGLGLTRGDIVSIAEKTGVRLEASRLDEVLSLRVADICRRDLDEVAERVWYIHTAYYTKIGSGVLAFIASIVLSLDLYRIPLLTPVARLVARPLGQAPRRALVLSVLVFLSSSLAAVLGWYVREVGRKPWTVYGLLYPEELVSVSPIVFSTVFQVVAVLIPLLVSLGGVYAMYIVATRELRVPWRRGV